MALESQSSVETSESKSRGFSRNRHQAHLVFVTLSVASLILGFFLVLVAVQAHVAPLYDSSARLLTRCYIVSIDEGRNLTRSGNNFTLFPMMKSDINRIIQRHEGSTSGRVNESAASPPSPVLQFRREDFEVDFLQPFKARESCVYVGVYYTSRLRVMKPGILQLSSCSRKSNGQTSKCFCRTCEVLFSSEKQNTTRVTVEGRTLQVGDMINCFYKPDLGDASSAFPGANAGEMQLWTSLKVIIWPTLLFIAGFVGTFFSCIYLQKDKSYEVR